MIVTVCKNGDRVADYHVKPSKISKAVRALKAFYIASSNHKATIEIYIR